jgi:2-methylcitrate dehydratase PrpD
VEAGFTGVPNSFDREGGWLGSPYLAGGAEAADHAYLVTDLGSRFELPLVGFKKYPVGGPTQPGVEAILELVGQVEVPAIERVVIEMPSHNTRAFAVAGMPALNLPYLAAIILIDGHLDFVAAQSLDRLAADEEVRALMARVDVRPDPTQDAFPRVESARARITLRDGAEHAHFVEHVQGFPARPMARDELVAKSTRLLEPHLGAAAAQRLCDTVLALDELDRLDPLVSQLILSGAS